MVLDILLLGFILFHKLIKSFFSDEGGTISNYISIVKFDVNLDQDN